MTFSSKTVEKSSGASVNKRNSVMTFILSLSCHDFLLGVGAIYNFVALWSKLKDPLKQWNITMIWYIYTLRQSANGGFGTICHLWEITSDFVKKFTSRIRDLVRCDGGNIINVLRNGWNAGIAIDDIASLGHFVCDSEPFSILNWEK